MQIYRNIKVIGQISEPQPLLEVLSYQPLVLIFEIVTFQIIVIMLVRSSLELICLSAALCSKGLPAMFNGPFSDKLFDQTK